MRIPSCQRPFVYAIIAFVFSQHAFGESPDITNISPEWHRNRRLIRNALIGWTETHQQVGDTGDTAMAGRALVYELRKDFAFDGDRLRYSYEGQMPGENGDLRQVVAMFAFDGTDNVQLFSPDGTRHYPYGVIHGADEVKAGLNVMYTTPILTALRPADPSLKGTSPRSLVFVNEHSEIDGVSCRVIEAQKGERVWRYHVSGHGGR